MRFASAVAAGVAAGAVAATFSGVALAHPTAISQRDLTSLAAPAVRSAIANDQFYFVMTDRYRDGDPSNNTGGLTGGTAVTGYGPASESYFHGGDLVGLTGACDPADASDDGLARLKRLGFTAVWITPPFVQRTVQGDSAAYHGYWFLDLGKPDPHLGTEADFAAFMGCAKKLGMKVFLDVVVNHTADVIDYRQGTSYVPVGRVPYRTATGKAFKPFAFTSGTSFPKLSPTRSFAKTPVVQSGYRTSKVPAILNDVTKYHNRGDISWGSCVGVCEMDGDFSGLDDLMTEDYAVVRALAQAYGDWITKFGIDGFRIDTAKHVDPYFFGRWLPMIEATASAAGKPGFTSFGEAWLDDTSQLSETMRMRGLPSVLDFPFQKAAREYVTGKSGGAALSLLFADDDFYTTASTNAYGLTTFLGNHDMGRIGFFLTTDTQATGRELLDRDLLAHDILYLTRGVPVVYYGDEVGMTGSGDGKDKRARQDMFPTQVQEWQQQERIGTDPIGRAASFEESTAIEARLTELARVRHDHPALATGALITRVGTGSVYAASRMDGPARTEYVVAFNNSTSEATTVVPTSTPSASWTPVLGSRGATSDASGALPLTLPPLSTVVLKAAVPLPTPANPVVDVSIAQEPITGGYRIAARVPGSDPSSVTFVLRRGSGPWQVVGTDDARPFRVFVPPASGKVTVAAVATDSAGQRAQSTASVVRLDPYL